MGDRRAFKIIKRKKIIGRGLDKKRGKKEGTVLFFTIIMIWEYIIKHQDMKEPLQQSYRNIALGSEYTIIVNLW